MTTTATQANEGRRNTDRTSRHADRTGRRVPRSLPNPENQTGKSPSRSSRLGPQRTCAWSARTRQPVAAGAGHGCEHAAPASGKAPTLELLDFELQLEDADALGDAGRGGSNAGGARSSRRGHSSERSLDGRGRDSGDIQRRGSGSGHSRGGSGGGEVHDPSPAAPAILDPPASAPTASGLDRGTTMNE